MPDLYASHAPTAIGPIIGAFTITPHATDELPQVTRQIRVTGSAGNVTVVWPDGTETTEPVEAGGTYDWRVRAVRVAGTTATGLRGYF
jgi:hypothetical protein